MKNLFIQKILVFFTIVIVGINYANASMLLQDSLVFEIDDNNIKLLESAPSFTGMENLDNGVELALPDPSGIFVNYSFFKNNVLSERTANEYPGIFTLTGYSLIHKDHFRICFAGTMRSKTRTKRLT